MSLANWFRAIFWVFICSFTHLLMFTVFFVCFFLSGFSFKDTDNSQDSREREGTIFYSTLPLLPVHKHSDIYLQLCTRDNYHIFLNPTFLITRLLLDEIYHLIELLFDWLMMWCLFSFGYLFIWFYVLLQLFDLRKTGGVELASNYLTWEKPVDSDLNRPLSCIRSEPTNQLC